MNEWYRDFGNVADLCKFLLDEWGYDDDGILDVVRYPWRYGIQWERFKIRRNANREYTGGFAAAIAALKDEGVF